MYAYDEIVEDRVWRNGVEIVSHVNWSHLARVRRSLGLIGEVIGGNPLAAAQRRPGSKVRHLVLQKAEPRAA
jgi:hypothetical protein